MNKTPKRALITGITGQDGSYLAEFLLSKGYEVHGLRRRSSSFNTSRIDHLIDDFRHDRDARLFLDYGDLTDSTSLIKLLYNLQPDEIYNLGAQSHVHISFEIPEYTSDVTGVGCARILEAVRETGIKTRIYQASSSEMFGSTPPPQNENSRFHPRSPYACAKVFGYNLTVNYRESYDIFACNGILFNHESPRRGENFVTRKITRAIARIKRGLQEKLYLGNLAARRDWGYAPEYVEAMWLMLQQDKPDDYVIATGQSHSVQEFLTAAFEYAGLDWQKYVEIDPRYYRPAEVNDLIGDAAKAKTELGWEFTTHFPELVRILVDADIEMLDAQLARGETFIAQNS
ncbi:MAG: GDP-mannose 4,6-dehydratase [Acidobacteriota bacterium]|nr:GDP-mannose 4,6-dehydratase [Acidobacteriota bacterium]